MEWRGWERRALRVGVWTLNLAHTNKHKQLPSHERKTTNPLLAEATCLPSPPYHETKSTKTLSLQKVPQRILCAIVKPNVHLPYQTTR